MAVERKIFILDTSAIMTLVQDVTTYRGSEWPAFAGVLGDNEIVIPRVVLDELAGLRRSTSAEKSKVALECAKQLEYYSTLGSLVEGVETEKGGLLRIAPRPASEKVMAWGLKATVADHEILATAIEVEDSLKGRTGLRPPPFLEEGDEEEVPSNEESPVVLLTQDRILRVLARSVYGVTAEELKSVCAPEMAKERGIRKIELSGDEIDQVLEQGYYQITGHATVNEFFHLVDRENPEVHYCYAMLREPATKQAEIIDRTKVDYLKVAK